MQILILSIARVKIHQIQSLDHSSVLSEIILLHFSNWNFICFWQKEPIKVQIFSLPTVPMKIKQIPYIIFETTSPFFFKYCITFSVMTYTPCVIFSSTSYLGQKKVSQSANFKIFESSSEIHQIPHVIYETTSQFSFKVCINLQYNDA